ncbi:hypothetical protein A2U01_0109291, partial [Trifolium medium]|nr:hypothetical protein [Trifolium medium]
EKSYKMSSECKNGQKSTKVNPMNSASPGATDLSPGATLAEAKPPQQGKHGREAAHQG